MGNRALKGLGWVAIFVLELCGLFAEPAAAATFSPRIPVGGVGDTTLILQKSLECLNGTTGTLTVSPDRVVFPDDVTIRWTTTRPAGCEGLNFVSVLERKMGLQSVPPAGWLHHEPVAAEEVRLHVRYQTYDRVIAVGYVAGVTTGLDVPITGDHQGPVLVQALGKEDSTITVAEGVDIDLSSYGTIFIARGVTLQGGRGGLKPGARLYTTQRLSDGMFKIVNDGVRISGLRIEGPDTVLSSFGSPDASSRGILIDTVGDAPIDVEIDGNEIYGWSGVAIEVQDNENVIPATAPFWIRIHDNYIHHNQNYGGNGYGVATRYGGYALIEHNVFDWNRHAIAAGAQPGGTGYVAEGNLVLEHGGIHERILGVTFYTHQFDAHGTDWNLGSHNAGPAGESFYIYRNTFFYTHDNAIKLRGTPQIQPYGMFVAYNMFAHQGEFWDAVSQTETGLWQGPGNVTRNVVQIQPGVCDFDGDAIRDDFMTTGVTWWYRSGGVMQWSYLNTSSARVGGDLTLGYVNGDGLCDVTTGGTVYSGGRTPLPKIANGLVPMGSFTLR